MNNESKKYFSGKRSNLILLAFIIVLFFLNYYNKTIFFRPSGMHQWRQSDCLSIAKNYYEQGMHFFKPEIHFQGGMFGKAVSEFPILNYTVAGLWKIFGEHEFIYRLLEYLIFIASIFFLFNTLLKFFKSSIVSFFSASLLLTSPLLVFYGLNFLSDVPALSLSIISFCLTYNFYSERKLKYFYWALAVGTLAVLMKASALIPLLILYFFSAIDLLGLNKFFKTETLFLKKVVPMFSILCSLIVLISWYKWALYYNENNSNNIFLLTILPIWKMEEMEIITKLKFLFERNFPVFLNKPMFFLFFTFLIYVFCNFKKLPSFLKYSLVFTALFFVTYLIFFFQVFDVHDYYLCNLMIFPVVTLFCLAHLLHESRWTLANKKFALTFLIGVTLFNSFHSAAIYRLRMIEDDKLTNWFPFVNQEEEKLAKYLFWDYGNSIKRIENFTPNLRSHGIKREDQIITTPDQSFNISLYFMDQKGFTIAKDHFLNDTIVLEKVMMNDVKYLVMSDTTLKITPTYKRMKSHLQSMFVENRVEVFKIIK